MRYSVRIDRGIGRTYLPPYIHVPDCQLFGIRDEKGDISQSSFSHLGGSADEDARESSPRRPCGQGLTALKGCLQPRQVLGWRDERRGP